MQMRCNCQWKYGEELTAKSWNETTSYSWFPIQKTTFYSWFPIQICEVALVPYVLINNPTPFVVHADPVVAWHRHARLWMLRTSRNRRPWEHVRIWKHYCSLSSRSVPLLFVVSGLAHFCPLREADPPKKNWIGDLLAPFPLAPTLLTEGVWKSFRYCKNF